MTGRSNVVDEGFNYRTVALRPGKIEEGLELMREIGILNFSINTEWGWNKKSSSLEFLKKNPWIEGAVFVDEDLDLGVLNALPNLKRVQLPDKFKGKLDFGEFVKLEVCRMKWNENQILNFDKALSLRHLYIYRLNQPGLSILRGFNQLIELELAYGYNSSLEGLGKNHLNLKKISFLYGSKLSDINALDKIPNLEELKIIGCKKLFDYSVLKQLQDLRNLVLGDGNPIGSLEFLSRSKISTGFIGVEVMDGDIEVLKSRNIDYRKFKSYS